MHIFRLLHIIVGRSRPRRAFALAALLTLVLGSAARADGRGSQLDRIHVIPTRSAPAASAVVLYDGALGGTPETQGVLQYLAFPRQEAQQTFASGVTTLTTTQNVSAGYSASLTSQIVLDRAVGYTLSFTAQVISESHAGSDRNGDSIDDRAGFSMIVLSSDKKGVELGFWPDRIWAQEGGTPVSSGGLLFTQAEGTPFDTTAGLVPYQLRVSGDTYSLSSNGTPILSGSLRDYTAFTGLPDVYETPNFVFFGDDTTSAQATIKLSYAGVGLVVGPNKLYLPLAAGT